jgi:hypothetical protein
MGKPRIVPDVQHKREVEAPGTLDDGPPSAGTPEDRDPARAAPVEPDLAIGDVHPPEDDARLGGLPETEEAFTALVLPQVEKSFIKSDLGCGPGGGEFDELHCTCEPDLNA